MEKNNLIFRAAAVILLTCFIQLTVLPATSFAQTPECTYDRSSPTLESARISFKSLNYYCAEKEIEDFLKLETIGTEQRADAHVLLAAVYYAKVKNQGEKRSRVVEQFKQAFRAFREWRGELDISSTEFIGMMNEAQAQVDLELKELEEQEEAKTEAIEPQPPAEPEPEPAYVAEEVPPEKEGKAWYKQWWAIGLGVGLVAGVVVIAAGGGDDDGGGTVNEPLPYWPDTPSKKK